MSDNNTIAKNTLFLYLRMLFTIFIGLYTSRLVLQTLGVIDYGIYSVVGGVLALFTFLHSALSGSTIRFLNVNMLHGIARLKVVFNTSLILHYLLGLIVLLVAETIGLWLFYNKLSIPIERQDVAFWVYQISVVTSVFSIIQIPYDATIIAKERMNIYAYLSITEAFLKLIVILLVSIIDFDNLLLYAIFILVVSISIRLMYQIYCVKNFEECKFSRLLDRDLFKQMLRFFGWDFYGNMCFALNTYGINILQNIFFGPIINASIAIVNQAQLGISQLGNNITFAIKPQMIQSYSKENYIRMDELLIKGTKFAFLILSIFTIPLFVFADYGIKIWLGELPIYSDVFLRIAIITLMINVGFSLLIPIIHATGRVFFISFIGGSIYLLSLCFSYFFLKLGYNPTVPYIINAFFVFLAGLSNVFIVKKLVKQFNVYQFLLKCIGRLTMCFLINLFICLFIIEYIFPKSFLSLLLISVFSAFITIFLNFSLKEIKNLIITIKNKFLS